MIIGCLPTYAKVGVLSPLLLLICRLAQGFFAAGETSGGAIYLLESSDEKKSDFMSALYDSSTVVGIFLASLFVTFLAKYEIIDVAWRYLFWIGGLVAFFGVFLRRRGVKNASDQSHITVPSTMDAIKTYWFPFLAIIITSGFSHATYTFPFTLMSGFIPLISSLTKSQLIAMNTQLLLLDLILLPIFGVVAMKIGRKRLMIIAASLTAITTPLCFLFLDLTLLWQVALFRVVVVTCGVAFAAAYHSYAVASLPMQVRYTLISLGSSIGALVLGKPVAVISLAFYHITGSIASVGMYFAFLGLLATIAVMKVKDHAYVAYK